MHIHQTTFTLKKHISQRKGHKHNFVNKKTRSLPSKKLVLNNEMEDFLINYVPLLYTNQNGITAITIYLNDFAVEKIRIVICLMNLSSYD